MCFLIDPRVKKLDQRIVYKVLERRRDWRTDKLTWTSPYRDLIWETGETKEYGGGDTRDTPNEDLAGAGIYVCLTLEQARDLAKACGAKNHKVFRAYVDPADFIFADMDGTLATYKKIRLGKRVDKTAVKVPA